MVPEGLKNVPAQYSKSELPVLEYNIHTKRGEAVGEGTDGMSEDRAIDYQEVP